MIMIIIIIVIIIIVIIIIMIMMCIQSVFIVTTALAFLSKKAMFLNC